MDISAGALSQVTNWMSSAGRASFTIAEFADMLGLAPASCRRLIRRLGQSGRLLRVSPGRYLICPVTASLASWTPSEAVALKSLILEAGGSYQLCGPNAFQHYGWDEQIPNRVSAYNTLFSGGRVVGAVVLDLIKVSPARLGGIAAVAAPDRVEVIWPTRARALLDAVYDWSRFNSLPRGYDWIRRELRGDPGFAADFVEVTLQFANQGTLRRIGRLLDSEGAARGLVCKLERRLNPSSSFIPWDPSQPKRGAIDRRWGVICNADV